MIDETFDVLADETCRRVLLALAEREPQGDAGFRPREALADGDDAGDQLQVRLHHVHLPKLEQAELIEWDREGREVRKGSRFEDARPILKRLATYTDGSADDSS